MGATTRLTRLASVAVSSILAAAASGCAGGEESAAAKQSAQRWANSVCTDLRRWVDTAESGSPAATAEAGLRLRSGIARTEPPATDDGLAAQGEMEKLATAIEQAVRTADPASIAVTVRDARRAVGAIRGLTPGAAVEAALGSAPPCREVRG